MSRIVGFQLTDKRVHIAAKRPQCFKRKLVDAPADTPVQQFVFFGRQHHQVLRSVVETIRIAVMHVLVALKRATENAFHDQPVFSDALAVNGVNPVSVADGPGRVGAPPVFWIEYYLGQSATRPYEMHVAERPELAHKATPLARFPDASWYLAERRQRNTARAANLRALGERLLGQFKRAPHTFAARVHTAKGGASIPWLSASVGSANQLVHVAILAHIEASAWP